MLQKVNKPTKGSIISHNKCLIDMKLPNFANVNSRDIYSYFFVSRLTQKVHKISHRNNWTAKLMKSSQSMKIIECLCLLLSMSMPEIFARKKNSKRGILNNNESYWDVSSKAIVSMSVRKWYLIEIEIHQQFIKYQ